MPLLARKRFRSRRAKHILPFDRLRPPLAGKSPRKYTEETGKGGCGNCGYRGSGCRSGRGNGRRAAVAVETGQRRRASRLTTLGNGLGDWFRFAPWQAPAARALGIRSIQRFDPLPKIDLFTLWRPR